MRVCTEKLGEYGMRNGARAEPLPLKHAGLGRGRRVMGSGGQDVCVSPSRAKRKTRAPMNKAFEALIATSSILSSLNTLSMHVCQCTRPLTSTWASGYNRLLRDPGTGEDAAPCPSRRSARTRTPKARALTLVTMRRIVNSSCYTPGLRESVCHLYQLW